MKPSFFKDFWPAVNLVACVVGAVGFIFFAIGIERHDSRASRLLEALLENPWLVISVLVLLGVLILWPLFRRKSGS